MSNPKIFFKFAHKVFALYRPLFKMIRQENENDNTTVPRTAHQQFLYMHALALDSREGICKSSKMEQIYFIIYYLNK